MPSTSSQDKDTDTSSYDPAFLDNTVYKVMEFQYNGSEAAEIYIHQVGFFKGNDHRTY